MRDHADDSGRGAGELRPSIVQELRSDKYEDLEQNVARVCEWLENWKKEHSNE